MLTFQLISAATRWYIIGFYILPNDLTTLTHIKHVWQACPKGCLPIMLGDLNVNLATLHEERDKMVAKQVDTMALVDTPSHFCQWPGKISQG